LVWIKEVINNINFITKLIFQSVLKILAIDFEQLQKGAFQCLQ